MGIFAEILSVLACPKCKSDLTLAGDEASFICETCRVAFPIRDGVPTMLLEESMPLQAPSEGQQGQKEPSVFSSLEKVTFVVVEGKQKGEQILVDKGTCRAVGRSLDEVEKTKIFEFDPSITLDEASKKLVMQYLSKHFHKGDVKSVAKPTSPKGSEHIGGFLRGPDVQVKDLSVSRLHAMIFFDDSGITGVLDLVSKNGTYVNGAEVESRILKKGDLITLGGTKVRFES